MLWAVLWPVLAGFVVEPPDVAAADMSSLTLPLPLFPLLLLLPPVPLSSCSASGSSWNKDEPLPFELVFRGAPEGGNFKWAAKNFSLENIW